MTQAMEMARKPWMHGTVSLPTFRSQITLKLVMTENDNRSRHQTLSFFAIFIDTSAKFSSELLLFMPCGMTIPMGRSFLLGAELLNAYVVSMLDDESVASSSFRMLRFSNVRLARFRYNSYIVATAMSEKTIVETTLLCERSERRDEYRVDDDIMENSIDWKFKLLHQNNECLIVPIVVWILRWWSHGCNFQRTMIHRFLRWLCHMWNFI